MAGHSDNVLDLPRFEESTKLLIVIAPYYGAIAAQQLASARAVIEGAGATHETVEMPGSLEIPTAIGIAHRQGDYDGYVALGCVIRGRTSHYDVVVNESARAIATLGLAGACIGNGIITVENMEQAEERADAGRLDTAGGAAAAALHLIALQRSMGKAEKGLGFRPGGFRHDAAAKPDGPTVA
ncbi:6,7-dimethyl-8-ribityllumazine synthase [Jannaschia sp. Os4]|uniref:6,7-dimethyl-8-ribityllumazine synthase n=1 Tax=Jannaschia sp. Os4 TaxID=2807617 RepID=UPI00193A84F3|nr:6,7-dimethyl-8-ribityllumazine synthase [Jannaschia sp. Os4]MBM2577939.1 6,7-dimethyl-8-ribityllumazine synthase [Jannaschia sp. Os4]